jgi:hypothetical protein
MEFCSSSLLRWLQEVMACQAASATASLRDALKAGPWCLQRTLGPEKISATALNSTCPRCGTPLILYLGGGGDAHVSWPDMKPADRDRGFSTEGFPFISISV